MPGAILHIPEGDTMWFKGLNGIRAFSAIAVVFTHIGGAAFCENHGIKWIYTLFNGPKGVDFFYTISGFLITSIIYGEKKINFKKFYIGRTFRLFPVYYFSLLFICLSTILHNYFSTRPVSFKSLGFAAVYLYNFIPKSLYDGWLGSYHTLATEMQFYLIFPVVVLLLKKRRALLIAGIAIWLLVGNNVLMFILKSPLGKQFFVDRWTFFAGQQIAIGILIFFIYEKFRDILNGKNSIIITGLLFYILPLVVFPNSGFNRLVPLGIGMIILHVLCNQDSLLTRILNASPLDYIGKISYSIYIWQSFFLTTGRKKICGWPLDLEIGLPLLFIASIISYHLIEKKFIIIGKNVASTKARNNTQPAA